MTETRSQSATATEDQGGNWECPACTDPFDREYCHHEPAWEPLARSLCVHFHGDDEEWGTFLDDADVLFPDAGPGPEYTLIELEHGQFHEWTFVLNNLIVAIGEGGKDSRSEPEIVAKLPAGMRIEVSQ